MLSSRELIIWLHNTPRWFITLNQELNDLTSCSNSSNLFMTFCCGAVACVRPVCCSGYVRANALTSTYKVVKKYYGNESWLSNLHFIGIEKVSIWHTQVSRLNWGPSFWAPLKCRFCMEIRSLRIDRHKGIPFTYGQCIFLSLVYQLQKLLLALRDLNTDGSPASATTFLYIFVGYDVMTMIELLPWPSRCSKYLLILWNPLSHLSGFCKKYWIKDKLCLACKDLL